MQKIKSITITILSLLFSFFMVSGYSFLMTDSLDLINKNLFYIIISIISFIIYFILFNLLLKYIYYRLDNRKEKETKIGKLFTKFDEHPFKFSLIFMLICWLPYIISFFPAILSPDPSFQIKQFFGIENKYSTYSIMLDESVLITNHHPVIHTLLLGVCVKIGTLFNSTNLGLFIYSLIQISILVSTLAFTLYYLKKINVSYKFRKYILFIYAFVPVFPFYAMSAVKDVIFGALIILYIILLNELIKKQNIKLKEMIVYILLMIFIILFRNNGIYVIVLSFPFLFFNKQIRKKLIILFIIPIIFYLSYSKIILPSFKITPGSIRETLSIPFQQTARYVKEHESDLTDEQIKSIDKILDISDIATRYKPNLADPVKNKFNRYYKDEDLKNYFKTWFECLLKHPDTYIEATMNNVYGYFYPIKTNWYIYNKYDTRIVKDGFDYHYNSLDTSRTVLSSYGFIFPYIPILGLIVNIGFNTWLMFIMFSYLIYRKKYKEMVYLLPGLILILVCIASPANTYFRYALPYIFGMPLMIGIFESRRK